MVPGVSEQRDFGVGSSGPVLEEQADKSSISASVKCKGMKFYDRRRLAKGNFLRPNCRGNTLWRIVIYTNLERLFNNK